MPGAADGAQRMERGIRRFGVLAQRRRQLAHGSYEVRKRRETAFSSASSKNKSAVAVISRQWADDRTRCGRLPLDGTPDEDPVRRSCARNRRSCYGSRSMTRCVGRCASAARIAAFRWLDPQTEKRYAGAGQDCSPCALGRHRGALRRQHARARARGRAKRHPPIYYLVDFAAKKADILNEAYPLLVGVKLGAVRGFDYEARDKYALMAYLTVPPGATEKNLPLVVMPHGGPESRDEPGFDWLAQFLASRGYAVLAAAVPRLHRPRPGARRCGPAPVGPAHAG